MLGSPVKTETGSNLWSKALQSSSWRASVWWGFAVKTYRMVTPQKDGCKAALKSLLHSLFSLLPILSRLKGTIWKKVLWVISSHFRLGSGKEERVEGNKERLRWNQGEALREEVLPVQPDLRARLAGGSIFNCKVIWLGKAEEHWGGKNVAANTLIGTQEHVRGGAVECVCGRIWVIRGFPSMTKSN